MTAAPELLRFLQAMTGELCWFVQLSMDRVLRMEFGTPHLKIHGPLPHDPARSLAVNTALCRRIAVPTGVWHLFVDEAEWSVTTAGGRCSRSDRNERQITPILQQLDGQRLVNAEQTDAWSWRFSFDLGGQLELTPDESLLESRLDDDGLWTLFHESGDYITFPNGRLTRSTRTRA